MDSKLRCWSCGTPVGESHEVPRCWYFGEWYDQYDAPIPPVSEREAREADAWIARVRAGERPDSRWYPLLFSIARTRTDPAEQVAAFVGVIRSAQRMVEQSVLLEYRAKAQAALRRIPPGPQREAAALLVSSLDAAGGPGA